MNLSPFAPNKPDLYMTRLLKEADRECIIVDSVAQCLDAINGELKERGLEEQAEDIIAAVARRLLNMVTNEC